MNTTTTIDLDRLEALAKDTQIGGSPMRAMKLMRDFQAAANPAAILELIQLARRSQPVEAADELPLPSMIHNLTGEKFWNEKAVRTALAAQQAAREQQQEPVAEWVNWEQGFQHLRAEGLPDGTQLYVSPVAQQSGAGALLNAEELAGLRRFKETCDDGEGYDVPKAMMQRLAEIGVVRRTSGSYYETTDFGLRVLEPTEAGAPTAAAEPASMTESDARAALRALPLDQVVGMVRGRESAAPAAPLSAISLQPLCRVQATKSAAGQKKSDATGGKSQRGAMPGTGPAAMLGDEVAARLPNPIIEEGKV